jgi:MFS family permease
MAYLSEIRDNWRYVAAASIGQAAGYSLFNYIGNVFTPHLMEAFGWTRAELALVGATAFLAILGQPIAGRLTDAYGVRRIAMIGVVTAPLALLALSAMTSQLLLYFLIGVVQIFVVGGATTSAVYSRLIAEKLDRARGMSLAVAACAAPAVAALCIPLLSRFIDIHGWRAGYVAVAALVAASGVIAILLIPAGSGNRRADVVRRTPPPYGPILRSAAFRWIVLGVILCNLSFSLQTSQLKVMLLDRGLSSADGSWAASLLAFGVIGGRLLCGYLLDHFPAHVVTAIGMGIPCIGFGVLAAGANDAMTVGSAVLLLGLALGAEGDVLAYLVMRFFPLDVFSSVLGLVLSGFAGAVAVGSMLLSLTLKLSGSYTLFLIIASIAAFAGAMSFLQLGRAPAEGRESTVVTLVGQ